MKTTSYLKRGGAIALAVIGFLTIGSNVTFADGSGWSSWTPPPILAAGTTNYSIAGAPLLGVFKQNNVGIQVSSYGGSGGFTNIYTFAPSVDGINVETNLTANYFYLTNFCLTSGTNTNYRSVATGGANYFKLLTVVTTGASTNRDAQYGNLPSSGK